MRQPDGLEQLTLRENLEAPEEDSSVEVEVCVGKKVVADPRPRILSVEEGLYPAVACVWVPDPERTLPGMTAYSLHTTRSRPSAKCHYNLLTPSNNFSIKTGPPSTTLGARVCGGRRAAIGSPGPATLPLAAAAAAPGHRFFSGRSQGGAGGVLNVFFTPRSVRLSLDFVTGSPTPGPDPYP
ncbi:hypothetical protein J6590_029770 [Homalodisca vitripennis]|nr:hypothetical protein J6590_029770 [Homalodisca vitripennis]